MVLIGAAALAVYRISRSVIDGCRLAIAD